MVVKINKRSRAPLPAPIGPPRPALAPPCFLLPRPNSPARLRFVLAAVVLGLLSLDGFSRPGMTTSQVVSEALAGLAGVVLFAQALLDQQKERAVEVRASMFRQGGYLVFCLFFEVTAVHVFRRERVQQPTREDGS